MKMAVPDSITLKDVDQHKFVQTFSAFLKKYVFRIIIKLAA